MANQLKWDGPQVSAAVAKAALEGAIQAGEHLRSEAVLQTPVDTKVLRQSCEVSNDGKSHVVVSYDTPYAIVQHERTDYNHPQGGNAKYLENPFNSERETLIEIIGKGIQGELGR